MFSQSCKTNPLPLLKILAVFGLTLLVLCAAAANASAQTNRSTYLDFDGDGKTDWATIKVQDNEPKRYMWRILGNQTGSAPSAPFTRVFEFGQLGDAIHPGDYIGDRKTEMVVYRSGEPGMFFSAQFPLNTDTFKLEPPVRWGTAESDSSYAPGDYDGDGKIDYTVARFNSPAGKLTWFIILSRTNTMRAVPFGFLGGEPSHGADLTGDGRDELVYIDYDTNGTVTYYIGDAVTGAWLSTHRWGNRNLDFIYPRADYTGDGKADLVAVRRTSLNPMVWFIFDPATNTSKAVWWGKGSVNAGEAPDIPVQGDYDGDGIYDIAVYRVSSHTFYVLKSSDNNLIVQPWGETGDLPIVPLIIFLRTH